MKKQWCGLREQDVSTPKPDLDPLVGCSMFGETQQLLYPGKWYHMELRSLWKSTVINSVAAALHGKQDRVFLIHDTARAYVTKLTQHKLKSLGWAEMPHALYSTDVAPTDYNLSHSLQNHLNATRVDNRENLKRWPTNFFNSKSPGFYRS
ncbi:unnamed protein product [Bursaphelenchus okinawaensis]|uniref:DDE-1 domain-containing protein n=1 Tax=Bursaphelenchus okinawaensis TaxID=465554 RepID=A0A811KG85_9BILA|nr:unnamed protein product [Bursaphelenchus okinawaensis]CAG9102538.1 unnamed protein product [Bursaphelenchus okinawaensis]